MMGHNAKIGLFAKKALLLGALSSSSAFFFVPTASADVLEFKNGEVKAHLAVDYRKRPAEDQAGPIITTITITEWVQPPEDIAALIAMSAQEHDIDPLLLTAIMAQESNFDVKAVSSKGAMGLMQLMPDTATMLGVTDAFDAAQNIDGGVRYFKSLLGRYNGDRSLALAAYNAGTRAVDSYGGVPPYSETRDYIIRINDRYNATKPKPAPVEPPKAPAALLVYGGGERVDGTLVSPTDVPVPELESEDVAQVEPDYPSRPPCQICRLRTLTKARHRFRPRKARPKMCRSSMTLKFSLIVCRMRLRRLSKPTKLSF